MHMEERFRSWKKKTISKFELENLLHAGSEAELYRLISEAAEEGILSPVIASGTNGNRMYPMYLRYRITITEDYSAALSEIALLHPSLSKAGYLQAKPELYLRYREQLQKLNRFLFQEKPSVPVSRKERSFEIFDEEKQLEDSAFGSLLTHLGLTARALHYYDTPEYCFNDYIPVRKAQMTLLICENKDIWFNIRRRMYEDGADRIFAVHIEGVVYGSGNRVSEEGALSEYTRFLGADSVQYLYWGDIDRAGLNIYLSLRRNNPGLDIRLFAPAYEEMLHLAEGRSIPDSADHRERTGDYEAIWQDFPDGVKERFIAMIGGNKRIPQEIISYEALLHYMR